MLDDLVQHTRHTDLLREADHERHVDRLLGPDDFRLPLVSPALRVLGGGLIAIGTRLQAWAARPCEAARIEGRI